MNQLKIINLHSYANAPDEREDCLFDTIFQVDTLNKIIKYECSNDLKCYECRQAYCSSYITRDNLNKANEYGK